MSQDRTARRLWASWAVQLAVRPQFPSPESSSDGSGEVIGVSVVDALIDQVFQQDENAQFTRFGGRVSVARWMPRIPSVPVKRHVRIRGRVR